MIERFEGDGRTVVGDDGAVAVGFDQLATLFAMHYDALRSEHARHGAPGVLAVVYDLASATIAGTRWTKTRPDAINAFSVGRHRECDVCLPKDRAVSLRHLLVVSHPYASGARRVSFRILDLRTQLAFADCFGQRLEAVIAEGATMVVIGRYALLLAPTGDGTRLPPDASVGWSAIADPLYLDPQGRRPARSSITAVSDDPRAAARDDAAMQRSSLSVIEGPARASAGLLAATEEPLGALELSAGGEARKLVVGERAASQGILLGSYERCDDDRLSHVQHPSISRVHLVIWLHEHTLYAIDAASTNGTFAQRDGKRVRTKMARMADGMELVLADDRARVKWLAL